MFTTFVRQGNLDHKVTTLGSKKEAGRTSKKTSGGGRRKRGAGSVVGDQPTRKKRSSGEALREATPARVGGGDSGQVRPFLKIPKEEKIRDLERAIETLTEMARRGQITARWYNGQLVKLAWDYVKLGADVYAMNLITCISSDYFSNLMPKDAEKEQDEALVTAAEGLAGWLVKRGHVDADVMDPPAFVVTEMGRA